MKKIIFSLNGKEISRASLNQPFLLAGRSPHCDLILRAKNIKPVHFLIEWAGEGNFNPKENSWAVYDISDMPEKSEKKVSSSAYGIGVLVSDKKVQVGHFEVSIIEDKLAETDLVGSVVTKSIREKESSKIQSLPGQKLLEIVSIDLSSEAVKDVQHFEITSPYGELSPLKEAPDLKLNWSNNQNGHKVILDISQLKDAEMYQQGQQIQETQISIEPYNVLRVRWNKSDFYFRSVPKIEVQNAPLVVESDKFYIYTVLLLLLSLSSIFILSKNIELPEPEVKEPPRIAKIEVKEIPPPPPEEKKELEPQEVIKPKEVEKIVKAQTPQPVLQKSQPAPQPKNPVAPPTEVTSIGLLGAISKSPKGDTNKVSADRVFNEGLITDSVSGSQAKIVLAQPPIGQVGGNSKTNQGKNGNELAKASSQLNSSDTLKTQNIGTIAKPGASGELRFGVDEGYADTSEESVKGGLDKESIRRALAAYRKEIRTCYERALMIKPKIQGRIVYNWNIHPKGQVTKISVLKTSTGLPTLDTCVLKVIEQIKFPEAPNGQPTQVIYPFEFQSKS